LVNAGIETARLDAEVLLGHLLAMSREQLVVATDFPLPAEDAQRYEAWLRRRLQREPVAYIIGHQEFWSLDFQVTRDVLIPRPETERLIEVSLMLAAELGVGKSLRIADIATGSGAIAVSLAKELPSASIIATDKSVAALKIARRNAALHGVLDRLTLLSGDLFEAIPDDTARFDLIVSNPPYIQSAEISTLEPEVSRWEPRAALDGGVDGLDYYRRIAAQAQRFLTPQGAVAMEIGADMGREVSVILNESRLYRDLAVFQDYAARDRVVVAKNGARRVGSK
jgi:release factor glutamine methyltransferase